MGNFRQGDEGMQKTMIVALMLACGTAQAADWVNIGSATQFSAIYADRSRVKADGVIRTTWFKLVYKPHAQRWGATNQYINYEMAFVSFNCEHQLTHETSSTDYLEDGSAHGGPNSLHWDQVVPDSVGEGEMNWICNLKLSSS
jgi:hypothetical protein